MAAPRSEGMIVALIAAVQFINILDFMMVMPLGPEFARALAIPLAQLGVIGGSYTAAAALSGLAGALFLDRFDRRKALAVSMLGLVIGTALGGLATGLSSLVAARVLAGLFGGPATSLSLSIIADVIPPERRGRAMGIVMASFSIASIAGVPLGLELALRGGWQMPFFAVAALGLVVAACAIFLLPPMRGHLTLAGPKPRMANLVRQPLVLTAYATTAVVMMSSFLIIPNIAAYVQGNLGYPREHMSFLYLAGGIVSFFATPLSGRLVDRIGSFRTGTIGAVLLLGILYTGFYDYWPALTVVGIFIGFMLAMSMRNVAFNTLISKVPPPQERAQFMSINSAVQHGAAAAGAFLSSRMLSELPGSRLAGIDRITLVAMGLTLLLPALLRVVEGGVNARALRQPSAATAPGSDFGGEPLQPEPS